MERFMVKRPSSNLPPKASAGSDSTSRKSFAKEPVKQACMTMFFTQKSGKANYQYLFEKEEADRKKAIEQEKKRLRELAKEERRSIREAEKQELEDRFLRMEEERKEKERERVARLEGARVVDKIYLGSRMAAQNYDWLVSEDVDVGFVLNATVETTSYYEHESRFVYKKIPIIDTPECNIAKHFNDCFHFIDRALSNDKSVLVHCKEGKSRSYTIILAYLMHSREWSLQEAFAHVSRVVPWKENINYGFKQQLMTLELQRRGEGELTLDFFNKSSRRSERVDYCEIEQKVGRRRRARGEKKEAKKAEMLKFEEYWKMFLDEKKNPSNQKKTQKESSPSLDIEIVDDSSPTLTSDSKPTSFDAVIPMASINTSINELVVKHNEIRTTISNRTEATAANHSDIGTSESVSNAVDSETFLRKKDEHSTTVTSTSYEIIQIQKTNNSIVHVNDDGYFEEVSENEQITSTSLSSQAVNTTSVGNGREDSSIVRVVKRKSESVDLNATSPRIEGMEYGTTEKSRKLHSNDSPSSSVTTSPTTKITFSSPSLSPSSKILSESSSISSLSPRNQSQLKNISSSSPSRKSKITAKRQLPTNPNTNTMFNYFTLKKRTESS